MVYQRNVRSSKVSESRPPFVLIQFLIVINKAVTERSKLFHVSIALTFPTKNRWLIKTLFGVGCSAPEIRSLMSCVCVALPRNSHRLFMFHGSWPSY